VRMRRHIRYVALAVVRYGIVAALIIEAYIFHGAHYWDDPRDPLTAWTPCLLLAVAVAFSVDRSWAIIKASPMAMGRALRSWLHW
jgi:hypothetical protein